MGSSTDDGIEDGDGVGEEDCDVFNCYADSPIPSSYACDHIDDCSHGDVEVGCVA